MGHRLADTSTPARLAAPDEGIGRDELALATRNHGLPLEAMRHDLTPPGLHYVLTHYDIPYVPENAPWALGVTGRVRRPLTLNPADLRARPRVTTRVTMECAGNGRALLTPRGDEGEPVTRIAPRALLVPPGFPDFMSRARVVRPGIVALEGRAWSGRAPVTRAEVSTDAGHSWHEAELEPDPRHRWAWRRWRFDWRAEPGEFVLSARATDAEGRTQPLEQPWNRGGFANNLVQQVHVLCLDEDSDGRRTAASGSTAPSSP